jgi:hypothetical protein
LAAFATGFPAAGGAPYASPEKAQRENEGSTKYTKGNEKGQFGEAARGKWFGPRITRIFLIRVIRVIRGPQRKGGTITRKSFRAFSCISWTESSPLS